MSAAERPHPGAELELDGHTVRLTSLDRPMFPAAGWRKADVIGYYLAVADALLPHLRGRPLTMGRFPDGVDGRGFLQNECRAHPPWMRALDLDLQSGARRRYCVVDDAASLAWVANLAAIELHPYPVTRGAPDVPAALVVDLDPGPGVGLRECCLLAQEARALLAADGLDLAVKTTGGAGLHMGAAVTGASFEDTRAMVRRLAGRLAERFPGLVTDDVRPSARAGAVLVDWMQNAPRRSTIAPYSLRVAARTPSVSAPLTWDEVGAIAGGGTPPPLDPAAVIARIRGRGDLFAAAAAPAR
jgi:bifunctional non-homologous end joining protein LigD